MISPKLKEWKSKRQQLLVRMKAMQEKSNILLNHSSHFKGNKNRLEFFHTLEEQNLFEAKRKLEKINFQIIALEREEQKIFSHRKSFGLALFLSLMLIISSVVVYLGRDSSSHLEEAEGSYLSGLELLLKPLLNPLLNQMNMNTPSSITGAAVGVEGKKLKVDLKDKDNHKIGEYTLTEKPDGSYDLNLSSTRKEQNNSKSVKAVIREIRTALDLSVSVGEYNGTAPLKREIRTSLLGLNSVEIANATIQLPKIGKVDLILECTNFDSANFNCLSWNDTNIPFEDKGDYVEFTVTHFSAYAGGEIIAIDAEHLEIDYSFISNIYSQVQTIDGVWSEPIYENEFVRVTYEHNLTDGKVIDVLARSNGTIAYFEVYEAGTTNLVGRSGSLDQAEMAYITINGLTAPTDTFDFKIVKVIQNRQECLNACNNECTENPYEGCFEQCNTSCSDVTFDANRTAFLEFDYIHDQAINSTNVNGLVVYGELAVATPRYRLWNATSNDFGAEASASSIGTDQIENVTWVVVRGNHERDEFIMGTEDAGLDINIQIFDASAGTWGNLLEATATLPTSSSLYRSFDIGIEDISGDTLIVYESSSTSDSKIAWIIWNGTGYSTETNLTHGLSSNGVRFVSLVSQPGTDNIMLVILNAGSDIYAVLWNGTTFDNVTTPTAPDNATASGTEQHFAFAWEGSGQGLLAYGSTRNVTYVTYDPSAGWGARTSAFNLSGTDSLDALSMCSDPNSDYIGLIWQDSGSDVNVLMWNGSEMLTGNPEEDATTQGNGASNINTRCEWFNSTTAMFGFSDTTKIVDWFTFDKPNTWSTANLTASTGTTVQFATGIIAGLQFSEHPTTSGLLVLAADTSGDISTIRWNGSEFINVTTNPLEQTDSISSAAQQMVMFDWTRFDPKPNVTNVQPSAASYTNETIGVGIQINATVTDNWAVSAVLANVTLPNSSIEQITLTDDNADGLYNSSYTVPTSGSYSILIIANDTSTHKNINASQTGSFTVSSSSDAANPTVTGLIPVNDSKLNVSAIIEIAANVTDNAAVDVVRANVTHPNGSSEIVTLTNSTSTPNRFNNSYNISGAGGTYNIYFSANDSSGNINNSEKTSFFANDTINPGVIALIPAAGSTFNITNTIEIAANVSDNSVSAVIANITLPNSTIEQVTLSLAEGAKYNNSYTIPYLQGFYNITIIANDSFGNVNSSEKTNFTAKLNCGDINNSMTMDQNVTSTGTCFTIRASNIILDCAGYFINYSTDGLTNKYGITTNTYDNVTIKNCIIYEGNTTPTNSYAIYLTGTVNSTIYNNTVYGLSSDMIYLLSGFNNISSNTLVGLDSSSSGIVVVNNNNSIDYNVINTTGTAAAISVTDGNNTIRFNNLTTTGSSSDGIVLNGAAASWNQVLNNTINTASTSSEGIWLQTYTHNNTISGNTLNLTGATDGISAYTPSNNDNPPGQNTIIYNTIYCNGSGAGNGINLQGTSNNNISYNTITANQYGIYLAFANQTPTFNTIHGNTIDILAGGSSAIFNYKSKSSVISSNRITTVEDPGIQVSQSNYVNISLNNITTGGQYGYGILLSYVATETTNYTIISSNVINTSGSSAYGIYGGRVGVGNVVFDGTIIATGANDIRIDDTELNLTNVTFNKTDIGFDSGALGNVTVNWYLDTVVQNSTTLLQNANVTIYNISNTELSTTLTNSSGQIPRQTLIEFWQNNETKIYQTPHTINTTLTGYNSNSTVINLTITNSTNITITLAAVSGNSAPTTPVLLSPINTTHITSRTPTFIWQNSTDADGNPITYNLIVDDNSAFNNPEINVTGIPPTGGQLNTTYLAVTELTVDTTYYWKVRANDSTEYGNFSDAANFTLDSYLSVNLTTSTIAFGSVARGLSYSTVAGDPAPFYGENIGNINANISINATPYFTSVGFPSSDYQFKMRANESGSFDTANSSMNWTNISGSSGTAHLANLDWRDVNDDFLMDINITIPNDEGAGTKSSTITFSISG